MATFPPPSQLRLSIRIDFPDGTRLGPGKIALLKAIHDTSSISRAAASLQMSYPRALKLLDQLGNTFALPLYLVQHGGAGGGGAELTEAGLNVISLYEALQGASVQAGNEQLRTLDSLTKASARG